MKTVFWSDLHLDHPNAYKWRTWLANNMAEHDEWILDTLSDSLGPRVYLNLLGDIAIGHTGMERLRGCLKLGGSACRLVIGNHDFERGPVITDALGMYKEMVAMSKDYSGMQLTHIPVHPLELRGKVNIHGHVHDKSVPDSRYVNVSIEMAQRGPVSLEQIRSGEHVTWNKVINLETGIVTTDPRARDQAKMWADLEKDKVKW